jgi:hypothetical protein
MMNFETNMIGREVSMATDSLEERKEGVHDMRGEVVGAVFNSEYEEINLYIAIYKKSKIVKRNITSVHLLDEMFVKPLKAQRIES